MRKDRLSIDYSPEQGELERVKFLTPSSQAIALLPFEQSARLRVLPLQLHEFRGRKILAFATCAGAQVDQLQLDLKFITGHESRGVIVPERELNQAHGARLSRPMD